MADSQTTTLTVLVVSADRIVWEGEASSVVARTTEGDIGILPRHEPMLAALVPSGAEIVPTDGSRFVVAVDGGFISVENNRVSLLSQFAKLADEIDAAQAQRALESARAEVEAGDNEARAARNLRRATCEVKALELASGKA